MDGNDSISGEDENISMMGECYCRCERDGERFVEQCWPAMQRRCGGVGAR